MNRYTYYTFYRNGKRTLDFSVEMLNVRNWRRILEEFLCVYAGVGLWVVSVSGGGRCFFPHLNQFMSKVSPFIICTHI